MLLKPALFSLAILSAVSLPFAAHAEDKNQPTLSVTGVGSVDIAPDMAIVSVGVVREAKTAREALDENTAAMNAVLKAMAATGIEERDLQTSGFNIQPRYFYPKVQSNSQPEAPRIVGYTVSNNLDIRIRDIDKTGTILDELVSLGVNSGGNIRFTNDDVDEILEQARKNAVKDAVSRANTLIEAAGAKLGKILAISENSVAPRPEPMVRARAMAAESAPVPIATGENSYQVSVHISWKIEQ